MKRDPTNKAFKELNDMLSGKKPLDPLRVKACKAVLTAWKKFKPSRPVGRPSRFEAEDLGESDPETQSREGNTGIMETAPITLTPKQQEVDGCPARFKLLRCGRRGGKTRYIVKWLRDRALSSPGKHWYVAKTYSLIIDEVWPLLKEYLPRESIVRINERSFTIEIDHDPGNGERIKSVIQCKTAEKEDNLRGRGLSSVALDEAAYVKEAVWEAILRPQLSQSKGPALLASSPKRGWFTRLFDKIKAERMQDWAAFHWTIYDNPHIPPDEIERIRRTSPEHVWRQEYMAEDVEFSGVVYHEFSDNSIFTPLDRFSGCSRWKTILGLDWGHDDPTAMAWLHISPEGYLVMSREYSRGGLDVSKHAEVIRSIGAKMSLAAEDVVLDTSAFRIEGTSRTSIAELFRKYLGYLPQRSVKDLEYGRDLMKRFLRGDGQTPWLYISTDCQDAIKHLGSWEYDTHEPDILAALRYGLAHAVKRNHTHLARMAPELKERQVWDQAVPGTQTIRLQDPRKAGPMSWEWDHEFGGPMLGLEAA